MLQQILSTLAGIPGGCAVRNVVPIVVAIAVWGCSQTTLQGPPAPQVGHISQVIVARLGEAGPARTIRERERIDSIARSFAFSESGWTAADQKEIAPTYRIEFRGRSSATYWVGPYPPAVSVPIYFYSNWWVCPATRAGEIDRTRMKVLADTVQYKLFQDLWFVSGMKRRVVDPSLVTVEYRG